MVGGTREVALMLDGSPSDSTDLDEALWLRNTYEKVSFFFFFTLNPRVE